MSYGRRLRRILETGVGTPRQLINASWQRSMEAGVDPERQTAPLVYDSALIKDVRRAHPLQPLLPMLAHTLKQMADESEHIMIVTDAEGSVLWRDGDHGTMRRADLVGLADGHHWSENSVGTNGIGTALATRKPVHVYSEEHLLRVLHCWSCSSAPIIDPDTDTVLGCVDVSGTTRSLHPATVALVATTARLAEAQLALRMHERDERLRRRFESLLHRSGVLVTSTGRVLSGDPAGLLGARIQLPEPSSAICPAGILEPFFDGFLLRPAEPSEALPLRLTFLGEGQPTVRYGDRLLALSLRHAEILTLLALHPRGLTAEQLSYYLYGDDGNPATIRAEIYRLRTQLGGAVAAKPYRLVAPVAADFLELRRLLAGNDATAVARAYTGPLLPRSESPEIRCARDELEVQVRTSLLTCGSADDLWTYAQTVNGRDDFQVLERVAATLPFTDHRAAAARARLSP
ncbi:GAF domain-containing protein [Nonomuraea sp. bgisy101]|uniref:helix-turn-helix domain-containing protein n=1 Tax=Nonomuraea sp. bgisy101 TaxID=3413784 RepID=UPI003D7138CC